MSRVPFHRVSQAHATSLYTVRLGSFVRSFVRNFPPVSGQGKAGVAIKNRGRNGDYLNGENV